MSRVNPSFIILFALSACSRFEGIGQPPVIEPPQASSDFEAMVTFGLPRDIEERPEPVASGSSLWTGDRDSLLGDRRSALRGDILTVVIEINDSAQITNSTDRSRNGSENSSVDALVGAENVLGDGVLSPGVSVNSNSSYSGDGSIRRNEQLTLRVAATIVEVLPNGVLSIEGSQQVRVNNELRELLVSGFVRPEDVSRQNEITYDNIAAARISYGGRGQISDVQQPRYGQQAADAILPF